MRPPRPSRKVMDAAQQERVTNLVRESIQIEKSQKKPADQEAAVADGQNHGAINKGPWATDEQTRKELEKADSLVSKLMEQ